MKLVIERPDAERDSDSDGATAEFTMEVSNDANVSEIKREIQQLKGIPISTQTLIFNGDTLTDDFNFRLHIDAAEQQYRSLITGQNLRWRPPAILDPFPIREGIFLSQSGNRRDVNAGGRSNRSHGGIILREQAIISNFEFLSIGDQERRGDEVKPQ